jgi:hypothetical protein
MKRVSSQVRHAVAFFTHRLGLTLMSLIVASLLLPVVATAAQADCVSVQGTIAGQQTGPTSFMGTVTGDLAGTALGQNFQIVKVSGDRTFQFVVDRIFVTAQGDLYNTVVVGVLSPKAPPVYLVDEHSVITGGTGAYAGATGNLDIHGIFDFSTGQFSVAYHGEVCTGQ